MQDNTMSSPTPTVSKKYNILVVEDEPDARELFIELLATVPEYEVQGAVDGEEALVKAGQTKFDMILLDIVMPRKDGIETLDDLLKGKDKYGSPIVIMLTNIGGDLAIEKALEMGAAGYKLKIDTDPEELLRYVDEMLKKKPTAPTLPATPPVSLPSAA